MKRLLTVGAVVLLCAARGIAQQVELLRPCRLGRWGVPPGNYSGITSLGNERYAVVDDKSSCEGFWVFRIVQDSQTGQITAVSNEGFRAGDGEPSAVDAEGIAWRAADSTVWISRESDQRILAYAPDGRTAGRELAVPAEMQKGAIVPNYGFEALGYDAVRDVFWTVTENVLKADGPVLGPGSDGNACLRLQCFDGATGKPLAQYAYMPDRPQTTVRGRQYAFGVVALCVRPDGSLWIMEREGDVARRILKSRTYIHIYKVCPTGDDILSADDRTMERMCMKALKKHLVTAFSTRMRLWRPRFANYEGLCEGAALSDGRRTFLLIADSQNGYGRRWCHLQDWLRVLVLSDENGEL